MARVSVSTSPAASRAGKGVPPSFFSRLPPGQNWSEGGGTADRSEGRLGCRRRGNGLAAVRTGRFLVGSHLRRFQDSATMATGERNHDGTRGRRRAGRRRQVISTQDGRPTWL